MKPLLDYFLEAHSDANACDKCPHLHTSQAADAWHLGRIYRQKRLPAVTSLTKSRGDSYRVDGAILKAIYGKGGTVEFRAA